MFIVLTKVWVALTMISENLKELSSFLSEKQILTDQKNLEFYGRDWIQLFKSNPLCVVFPKETQDVVHLVHWARKYKTALVPSGGRTGLSGGATAEHKEVIVSFEKMNQLIEFNEFESTLRVQPGMITQEVQRQAEERGLFMPISFSAEGSSQIGGNAATNAGGIHVIRYGLMRQWIRGLQVVTGKGETLQLGKGLIKDATGYSLLQLFIGSEGTLGFITEVTIGLTQKPSALSVFLLGVSDLNTLVEVYSCFKKEVPLNAFEMFTDKALEYVESMGKHKTPLSQRSSYYVLMEVLQSDQEKVFSVFEKLMSEGKIKDGTVSQNSEQAGQIWALRENISESIAQREPYKNDISVRISQLPEFLSQVNNLLKKEYPHYEVVWFGHIGDGNLHINILRPKDVNPDEFFQNCRRVNDLLFSKVQEFGGSISAEHGVGLLKKNYLHYSRSKEELQYMKSIKKVFDPDHILNPGKMLNL